MRTIVHQQHVDARIAHNNCRECRADNERRFVNTHRWYYSHVHDYLSWIQPRLAAISNGENSVNAQIWLKKFRQALDRRINLKVKPEHWRKLNDSYLERLRGMSHVKDANYLRKFAQTGASALN
jgi:hypothetical protein